MTTSSHRPSLTTAATRRAAWALCLLTLWAAFDSAVAAATTSRDAPPLVPAAPAPQDEDDDMLPPAAQPAARRKAEAPPAVPLQAPALRGPGPSPTSFRSVALSASALPATDRRNGVGAPLRC
jgi:hypothetical protein